MLLSKPSDAIANSLSNDKVILNQHKVDHWQIYKQGVLTNVFNPKVPYFLLPYFLSLLILITLWHAVIFNIGINLCQYGFDMVFMFGAIGDTV